MGRCKAALQQNQTGVRSGAGWGSRANSKSAPGAARPPSTCDARRAEGGGRRCVGACAAWRLRHQTGGRSEFGVTAPSAAAGQWGARGGPRCSTSRRHGQAGQGGQLSRDPGALARLRLLLDSEFTQLEDAPVILPGRVTSGLGPSEKGGNFPFRVHVTKTSPERRAVSAAAPWPEEHQDPRGT